MKCQCFEAKYNSTIYFFYCHKFISRYFKFMSISSTPGVLLTIVRTYYFPSA